MIPNVHISLMLAVQDAPAAVDWYKRALGATEQRNLGRRCRAEHRGAGRFVVGEPESNGWDALAPWGIHRQGGFIDPFGLLWLVRGQVPPATAASLKTFNWRCRWG